MAAKDFLYLWQGHSVPNIVCLKFSLKSTKEYMRSLVRVGEKLSPSRVRVEVVSSGEKLSPVNTYSVKPVIAELSKNTQLS